MKRNHKGQFVKGMGSWNKGLKGIEDDRILSGMRNPKYNPAKHKLYYCSNCNCVISYKASKNTNLCKSCSHKGKRNVNFGGGFSKSHRRKLSQALKGRSSPTKGKQMSEITKQKLRVAMTGKKHPEMCGKNNPACRPEVRAKMSKTRTGRKLTKEWKRNIALSVAKNLPHGKGSYYKNHYMRSSWEIAYAKYLDNNNIKWQYEPKPFEITYNYKGIEKEGTYTPDFYLPETKEYIEIKGWWRDDAQAKFKATKSQHPTTKLTLLMKKELKLLKVLT